MKIYIAGAENILKYFESNPRLSRLMKNRENRYFFTYLNSQSCVEAAKTIPCHDSICDSGAYSFFQEYHRKDNAQALRDPDDYVRKYIGWIQQNWSLFDYFVELDIQEILGYEMIMKWRDWFKRAGVWRKMIVCYHRMSSMDEFKRMVDDAESRYIAMESITSLNKDAYSPVVERGKNLPYNQFIKYCYENDCRVHGFACVTKATLNAYPFYSVDSSTMNGIMKWGTDIKWMHGKLTFTALHDKGIKKSSCTKNRVSPLSRKNATRGSLFRDEEIWAYKIANALHGYAKQEQYYTRYWKGKGVDWDEVDKRLAANCNHKTRESGLELQTGRRR